MEPRQFSLRDVLLSVALMSVGLGSLTVAYGGIVSREEFPLACILGGIGGIGAGVFLPFDRETALSILGVGAVLVIATLLVH